jgi:hypothetical protein
MKSNKSWLAVLAAVAALSSAQTLRAITFGELDNGRHPNVGALMFIDYQNPVNPEVAMCFSGVLIAPRVFLTGGHCTDSLEWILEMGYCDLHNYYVTFADDPYDQTHWLPIAAIYTHPGYKPAVHDVAEGVWADAYGYGSINIEDVGLIVLEEATDIAPAALPTVGFLDELKGARELNPETRILSVGYGSHETFPPPTVVTEPHNRELVFSDYRGINKRWLLLSMNVRLDNGGGGYGDSGGPKFWVDPLDGSERLVAITSRGDPLCVTVDIAYRIDTPTALDFIQAVIDGL